MAHSTSQLLSKPFVLNRTIFTPDLYSRVHSIWYANQPADNPFPTKQSVQQWFNNQPGKDAGAAFDKSLHDAFSPALETLLPERLEIPKCTSWEEERNSTQKTAAPFMQDITPASAQGDEVDTAASNALSLILLTDQVPRNIFRQNQGVIYSHFDILSRAFVRMAVAATGTVNGDQSQVRLDKSEFMRTSVPKRMFVYMPLMHSENLEDHNLFAECMKDLMGEPELQNNEELNKFCDFMNNFEQRHVDIIKQFGRYPYRNEAMGRESTEAEKEWLANGGERFSA